MSLQDCNYHQQVASVMHYGRRTPESSGQLCNAMMILNRNSLYSYHITQLCDDACMDLFLLTVQCFNEKLAVLSSYRGHSIAQDFSLVYFRGFVVKVPA